MPSLTTPLKQIFPSGKAIPQTVVRNPRDLAHLLRCEKLLPEAQARLAAEREAHAKSKEQLAHLKNVIAYCEKLKAMIDAKSTAASKHHAPVAATPARASAALHGLSRTAAAIQGSAAIPPMSAPLAALKGLERVAAAINQSVGAGRRAG